MRKIATFFLIPLATAAVALASFRVTVTKAAGFNATALSTVVVVSAECHESLDCRRLEREVATELRRSRPQLRGLVDAPIYAELLRLGRERYTIDLRPQLQEALSADALLEVLAPYGERAIRPARSSEVKVSLRLVKPSGEILFFGEGVGRPRNRISSPEKAGGEVAERIFAEVFAP